MYELKTEHHFDSAHFLTNYYGKCENLHGHRWKAVGYIGAKSLQIEGTNKDMVVDFGVFKRAFRAICNELDHTFLVEEGSLAPLTLSALESEGFHLFVVPWRTTAENIATYIANKMIEEGFPITKVEVYETPLNCAIYIPELKDRA